MQVKFSLWLFLISHNSKYYQREINASCLVFAYQFDITCTLIKKNPNSFDFDDIFPNKWIPVPVSMGRKKSLSCVTIRSKAIPQPRWTMYDQPTHGLSHHLTWPAAPRLTSHTCCVTDRSEANQCLSLLKVSGDTNTPLLLSGHREIPITLPLPNGGLPLIRGCPRRYQHSSL